MAALGNPIAYREGNFTKTTVVMALAMKITNDMRAWTDMKAWAEMKAWKDMEAWKDTGAWTDTKSIT